MAQQEFPKKTALQNGCAPRCQISNSQSSSYTCSTMYSTDCQQSKVSIRSGIGVCPVLAHNEGDLVPHVLVVDGLRALEIHPAAG